MNFATSESPEDFLVLLNNENPPSWLTYRGIEWSSSIGWRWELAPRSTDDLTVWVSFKGGFYFRFPTGYYHRKRRSAQSVLDTIQESAAAETAKFQEDIEIGDATVNEITEATIDIQEVAPVADPSDPHNQAWAEIATKAEEISTRVEDFYAALPNLGANSVLGSKKAYQFDLFFDQMSFLKETVINVKSYKKKSNIFSLVRFLII